MFVHASRPLEALTKESILQHRGYIEAYIRQHPAFQTTLRPWQAEGPSPKIVRNMITAGMIAGVGPMAAVAGAVAERVGLALLDHSDEIIVENGGDVFLKLDNPFTVGIFAGESPLSMRVGLRIASGGRPMAVCTSSGTVGHSLSLGKADAVCVVSDSCPLADAAATAVGNVVRSGEDISGGIEFGKKMKGVTGLVVIMGEKIGMWGDLAVVPLREKRG